MLYYHTFRDFGIEGIYDHEPLLSKYHFPNENFWKGKEILDIGCASGYFSKYFSDRGANVTAIDINTHVIEDIKNKYSLNNITVIQKDLYDINYDSKFDFIFCGSLLMHSFFPMVLLKIVYKSLKEGGLFVLCTGGIENPEPIIRVEKYLGRSLSECEKEIKSANESLWWLSPTAGVNMLYTIGFKNINCVDSFMLTSTPYGIKEGHNYSALHYVWQATK